MTGPDADRLGRRLAVHLRKNRFGICRVILDEAEHSQEDVPEPMVAVAELSDDMAVISILEKAGFLYLDQLEEVDLEDLADLPQMGPDRLRKLKSVIGVFLRQKRRRERKLNKL